MEVVDNKINVFVGLKNGNIIRLFNYVCNGNYMSISKNFQIIRDNYHRDCVNDLKIYSRYLLTCSDDKTVIFSLIDEYTLRIMQKLQDKVAIQSCVYSYGQIIYSTMNGKIKVFKDGKYIKEIGNVDNLSLFLIPNLKVSVRLDNMRENVICISTNQNVMTYDLKTSSSLLDITSKKGYCYNLLSVDKTHICIVTQNKIEIYNICNKKVQRVYLDAGTVLNHGIYYNNWFIYISQRSIKGRENLLVFYNSLTDEVPTSINIKGNNIFKMKLLLNKIFIMKA